MEPILQNEFQKLALDILIDFDKICESNNLHYSIAYGTLLGAVRHKGYIPWDDDIDVVMPRCDYEKLMLIKDEFLPKHHELVCAECNKNFYAPLAKIIDTRTVLRQIMHNEKMVLGVYMDIFVVDYIPKQGVKRNIAFLISDFLQKAWSFSENKGAPTSILIIRLLRKMAFHINCAPFFTKLILKHAKCRKNGYDYGNLMFASDRKRDTIPLNSFDNLIDIEFEGNLVKAFSDYKKRLTIWYGDYMQLPPESERVCQHLYEVYWK